MSVTCRKELEEEHRVSAESLMQENGRLDCKMEVGPSTVMQVGYTRDVIDKPRACIKCKSSTEIDLQPAEKKHRSEPQQVMAEDHAINSLLFNKDYSSELKLGISNALRNREDFVAANGAKVLMSPFPICVLPDILGCHTYVDKLERALSKIKFKKQHTDLMRFSQSRDLKNVKIRELRDFITFMSRFRNWLADVVGHDLKQNFDVAASCYTSHDHLLCHNDQLETRSIAFIYYLVPADWSADDGGSLDLFSTVDGAPHSIMTSILPKRNSLVFFEVTPVSYHQVSEILSSKSRLSLTGWFHSECHDIIDEETACLPIQHPLHFLGVLSDFINSTYFEKSNIKSIKKIFERKSEIMLPNFIKTDVFDTVQTELNETENWEAVGPPNKRSYLNLKGESIPPATKRLCEFLNSSLFLNFIASLLGVIFDDTLEESGSTAMTELERASTSSCSSSGASQSRTVHCVSNICKFTQKSYSLLHDNDKLMKLEALDAVLFLEPSDWKECYGGSMHYVDVDDGTPLITILPQSNCMNFVFHESGVGRFFEYINSSVTEKVPPWYYCITNTFFKADHADNCSSKE